MYPELDKKKSNIVSLTYREHYVAHHLLYRYYKSIDDKNASSKMAYAWLRMCKNSDGLHVTQYEFERAKKFFAIVNKGRKVKQPWIKGKHHTEETKKKISEAVRGKPGYWKGKRMSEDAKKKMSCSSKNKKQIICIELNKIFNSITEAANELNLKNPHLTRVLKGTRKSTGGYTFKYYEEKQNGR